MKKLLAIVIILFFLFNSSAFALDTLGSPVARLKKGQFSAGVDYSCSNMDLSANGRSVRKHRNLSTGNITVMRSTKHSFKIRGFDVRKVCTNLGYGITDDWDIFLRLGGTDTQWKSCSDKNFAVGFGTRTTLYEKGKLKLGAIAQFSWMKSNYNYDLLYIPDHRSWRRWRWKGELSLREIQIAIGATYKIRRNISIYGGPFLHYIDGNLNLKSHEETLDGPPWPIAPTVNGFYDNSYDIDEVSYLGGYIGAEVDICESISYNIEYQHTAAADALGMKLIWRFK